MNKVLVALDCSPPSLRAAEYAAGILSSLSDCSVTLFAVITGVPYSEEVLRELMSSESVELHGDDDYQLEISQMKRILAEAAGHFARQGFPTERLAVVTRPLRRGLAQDILDEARSLGCDTIVVGRKELSRMKQVILGNVPHDLIQKAEGLAVWVVDG